MNSSYYEDKLEALLNKKFPAFSFNARKKPNSKLSSKYLDKFLTAIFLFFNKSPSLFEKFIEEPNDSTKAFQNKFRESFKEKYTPAILEEIEVLLMSFVHYSHFLKASTQENSDKELVQTILNIEEVEKDIKKNILSALKKSQIKYPAISGLIGNSYFRIEDSIDYNLSYLRVANRFFKKFDNAEEYFNLFYTRKSGRPKDFTFDLFLIDLYEIGLKHFPKSPYAKLLKPVLFFTAEHYPNLIDKNDVKDWNLLRKRVEYQKKVEKKKKKSP